MRGGVRSAQRRSGGEREGSQAGGTSSHVPVMLDPVLDLLGPALSVSADETPVYLDATLGLAGHAAAVLAAHPRAELVGLDRDATALERSRSRLRPYAGRVTLVHAVSDEIPRVLSDLGIPRVHAVLFDLGVSSPQLDETGRGFAYSHDAPLDMRMDRDTTRTAEEIVNTYSAADLTRILRGYGEERHARRIADAIARARLGARVTSTRQLVDIIDTAVPAAARRTGGHPAKRTFQALRIEVNGELSAFERALPTALDALTVGGRVAVLAYHSLEDRIAKRVLGERATDTTPQDLPVLLPDRRPWFRLLTRGAWRPSTAETTGNPRAASARLRAAERIREAG